MNGRGNAVLIFEVDATGDAPVQPSGSGCPVRLVGRTRGATQLRLSQPREGDVSAVLLVRARTASRLLSCVSAVAAGSAPDARDSVGNALDEAGEMIPARHGRLTRRESHVLRLLADGETTREIAQTLSYSERTVKSIVHDLLAKLNCRTRAHAVALGARQGLI